MKAALADLYEPAELEQIRRQVVAYWSGHGVAANEIGRRLGKFAYEIQAEFPWELQLGLTEWGDPSQTLKLFYRIKSGDAEAALFFIFATQYDHSGIAAVLQART